MRYPSRWLIAALTPWMLVLVLVSLAWCGLSSFRSPYIVSNDCASLANHLGFPNCVQTISGELVGFVFGESGFYIRPDAGGTPAVPTQTQVCDDQASCTNNGADTIFSRSAASTDPDLRCDIGIVGGIPGIRCFDASGVELTFDNAVRAGQTADTTIDNGAGTQTSCISVADTGITDYSNNESCGAHTNTRYVSFREHDSPPSCAAGEYFLYADLSETSVKVCNNGSAAVIPGAGGAGDIEGVTAGVGLSGGGTSGTVSLALDLTEVTGAVTVGDGSQASQVWTWNLSGVDPVLTFSGAALDLTGAFSSSGVIQATRFRWGTTTCIDDTSDRLYHDTNCDAAKDAGEEFLDYKNTFLFQVCFAGEDAGTATLFLRPDCSEAVSAGVTSDTNAQATRYGPVPVAVWRNLRCQTDQNVPASTTFTSTFRIEGVDEGITCATATGAQTCSDTTNTEATTAGQMVSLKWADSTANDTAVRVRCTVEAHTE